ncbi:hypothetical protein [Nocardiopsis sp. MG754419]|uniref:hypothetical protein n=1 Tax=Nocardiopsis sp. MG754419 TaxID=2259865 RepID=UPI001BADCBA9|nr:hypothetical protein [Nocardiopsis sp. MG754419]
MTALSVALALSSTLCVLLTGPAAARTAQEEAFVVVRTDGDRSAVGEVAPSEDVALVLVDGAGGDPIEEPWATCTSAADGTCTFTIPLGDGGVAEGSRLAIARAQGDGAGESAPSRIGRTPELRPGTTYDSLTDDFARGSEIVNGRPATPDPAPHGVCGVDATSPPDPPDAEDGAGDSAGETATGAADGSDADAPATGDAPDATDTAGPAAAGRGSDERPCSGTVSVTKYLVPPGNAGDLGDAVRAESGWTFDADVSGTPGAVVAPASATTDATGSVRFGLVHPQGVDDLVVTVAEGTQDGYRSIAREGEPAVCFHRDVTGERGRIDLAEEAPVGSAPGFSVEVPADGTIECDVYGEPALGGDLTVDRRWEIDGETVDHQDRPDGFDARLALAGPDGADPRPQEPGRVRSGYPLDAAVTGTEDVEVPEGCVVDAVRMARGEDPDTAPSVDPADLDFELYAPSSRYVLTHAVSCDTTLTLARTADHGAVGTAVTTDWTLTADGPTAVEGTGAGEQVTDVAVGPGRYALGENGPEGYALDAWTCRSDDAGEAINDGGTVDVGFGQKVTCTAHHVFEGTESTAGSGTGGETGPEPGSETGSDPRATAGSGPSDAGPGADTGQAAGEGPASDSASVTLAEPMDGSSPAAGAGLPITGATMGGIIGTAALLLLAGVLSMAIVWQRREYPHA